MAGPRTGDTERSYGMLKFPPVRWIAMTLLWNGGSAWIERYRIQLSRSRRRRVQATLVSSTYLPCRS
jgi:hypothetical protein